MFQRTGSLVAGLLVASFASSGCLPLVAHGPQVENAVSGGLSAGFSVGPRYTSGDFGDWPTMIPSIGANISRGWRSDDAAKGGFQVGAHLPGLALFAFPEGLVLMQGDAYYQFPATRTGDIDAGVGINASFSHVMPYVQLGRISADGDGWYTTQGVGVIAGDLIDDGPNALAWIPSIAYQSTKGNRTLHYSLTGSMVRKEGFCSGAGCDPPTEFQYRAAVGVTLQFHGRR